MKIPNITGLKEHQVIPSPCHLNWEDLKPIDTGGRHCSECDCEVRDLTDMSSDEIYHLQDKLGGKLCGKIYKKNNYVVTEIAAEQSQITSKNNSKNLTLGNLTVTKMISGGIAALSLASCASPEVTPQHTGRNEAQAFPIETTKKVKETKLPFEPPCIVGLIALPVKK